MNRTEFLQLLENNCKFSGSRSAHEGTLNILIEINKQLGKEEFGYDTYDNMYMYCMRQFAQSQYSVLSQAKNEIAILIDGINK